MKTKIWYYCTKGIFPCYVFGYRQCGECREYRSPLWFWEV